MLIGRQIEIERLEKVYRSKEAQFVVLYGRRRIGKTYLIRQFFAKKKGCFFQATGIQKGSLKKQLSHFAQAMSENFFGGVPIMPSPVWDDAFRQLTHAINTDESKQKITIFLDELPWMATRRSGLLETLDYYWNQYWSKNPRIVLIVCGSSASWLIKNIIYNQGGLHNRCTCEIKLAPFNLVETHTYLSKKGIKLNKKHTLEIYMALGGIPYYLNYLESGLTATENLQRILFYPNAALKDEFTKLFHSLFTDANAYIELVKLIAQKKTGISRTQLESESKLSRGGGRLTQRLDQLVHTNFIESYVPWDKTRGEYYKVIDEFCLFYLYWLGATRSKRFPADYWLKQSEKPLYHVWAGYAFEAVCQKHINQIIKVLGIKTAESISSWRLVTKKSTESGAQIDLLIDRSDDAITIGEIKYTDAPFVISKAYADELSRKIAVFKQSTHTKKQIFLIFISANGVKKNKYSDEILDKVVTLDNLFTE